MAKKEMTFKEACAAYVHRFTMDHIPQWAMHCNLGTGKYHAPQYRSDREWFERTMFPPNNPYASSTRDTACHSSNQSWPLGQWLDEPFTRQMAANSALVGLS